MASFVLVLLLFACSVQLSYSHGRPTYVDKYDINFMCTLAKKYYSDYCQVNQASGPAPVRNPGKQTRGPRKPWSRNPKSRKPKSRKPKSKEPEPTTAPPTPPPPTTAPPTPPAPTTAPPTPAPTTAPPTPPPTTAPPTPPPTTAPPTPPPTTAPPTPPPAESTMPTVADKTFLTGCTQRCVRSDLVASLCSTGTLATKCDNLLVADYVGSYTCCSG
ncbi:gibberellin-regulated protein 14-like [Haliotis rufescens]|uniref:gibberellin-regulated protein 14-like n=1 Tax=Haliotis rufescens TaxID=6454 RepID=UPI00201EE4E4|nr:gibberellin-regulated protein 14-like [Haliotis rufescens]